MVQKYLISNRFDFLDRFFTPINISLLPFCHSNNIDSFLTIDFLTKTMKKLVRNYQINAEKKLFQKIKTVIN